VGPFDNKGRDEKYWRTEFQKARDALKKAEDSAQLLDLKIKELNTQLLRQSDMYNREYRLGPEIAATQQQLDDAHKQVEEANKRISDLQDELRRSGGPAGWAR
jgi:methylphosphotriester-DNA--protein-cysteine methyltransferase